MPRRPLDVLEESLGALVTVTLKGQTTYVGRLVGFDQHMNVVLEDANRSGDQEGATPDGSAITPDSDPGDSGGEGGGQREVEVETGTEAETGGSEQSGGDTIVIRGDNVVTITS